MVYVYMMNVECLGWLSVSLSACKYFIRFHVFENTLKVLCSYTFYYSDAMVWLYRAFVYCGTATEGGGGGLYMHRS